MNVNNDEFMRGTLEKKKMVGSLGGQIYIHLPMEHIGCGHHYIQQKLLMKQNIKMGMKWNLRWLLVGTMGKILRHLGMPH